MSNKTYLTTNELSKRIHYNARTIRNSLMGNVLIEGIHYMRPFGRRKILFIWEAIERDMFATSHTDDAIPMAGGGTCHG